MFTLVQCPDDWQALVERHQAWSLTCLPEEPCTTLTLGRDTLEHHDSRDWALVRPRRGVVGLAFEGNRLVALEAGDCWLAHPSHFLSWFQEGAIELEVWHWSAVPPASIPDLIGGFNDSILALLKHNARLPQDPSPGFEFFRPGEALIREGEPADCVYTLIQGRARVVRDGVELGVAREGEILGLQAMLLATTRTASVIADTSCSAVRVEYDKFQNLIASRPELVVSTLETMARQIERMNQRLLQIDPGPNDDAT